MTSWDGPRLMSDRHEDNFEFFKEGPEVQTEECLDQLFRNKVGLVQSLTQWQRCSTWYACQNNALSPRRVSLWRLIL